MSDLPIRLKDFKVSDSWLNKIRKIVTPFSYQFWLTVFLYVSYRLLNKYIISNFIINIIYFIMCLIILFY